MTKTEKEQHWQAIYQQQRENGLTKADFVSLITSLFPHFMLGLKNYLRHDQPANSLL